MVNKKFTYCIASLALVSLLFSCNSFNNNNNENSQTKASDDELKKTDELRETFTNPISIPNANGNNLAADPFVLRYNGKYYMYSTGNNSKIRSYVSDDLVEWTPTENVGMGEGVCLGGSSSLYPSNVGAYPYAPEVIYYNGYFYLITSITGNGHFVFKSETPYGPFSCISGNLERSIDGSFFIDSDEEVYLFTSGGTSLTAYQMEDDFVSFKDDNRGEPYVQSLLSCGMGAWTEGPYCLLKDSNYYMTYTGTHYLSNDYRVDYAYAPAGSDPSLSSSYSRRDTILLDTSKEYHALGHSCTVCGPDLDSYYIVYHNMNKTGSNRYLNIGRLEFNGADMYASGINKLEHFKPRLPEFSAEGDTDLNNVGNFLVSNSASNDDFTCEFNVTGNDKMIFSFKDENNYSYATFDGKNIKLYTVTNGTSKELFTKTLNKEYDLDVNHCFRFAYRNNKLDIHFDNIEVVDDTSVKLSGGKIGFTKNNTFEDIGYLAFSNVAQGTSNKEEYKEEVILANSYDEKLSYLTDSALEAISSGSFKNEEGFNLKLAKEGDRATYRAYFRNSSTYDVNLRVPASYLGKKIGLQFGGSTIKEVTIGEDKAPVYKKGDVLVNLGQFDVNEGGCNLSLVDVGDNVAFSRIELNEITDSDDFDVTFDATTDTSDFTLRNSINKTAKGLETNAEQFNTVTTLNEYEDYEVSATFTVNNVNSGAYFGLMLNAKNYGVNKDSADSTYQKGNYETNYQGLSVTLDRSGSIGVNNVDYSVNTPTYGGSSYDFKLNKEYTLTVEKRNNNYVVYLDDEQVYSFSANISNLKGILGFQSFNTDLYLKNFSVVNL